MRKTTPFRLGFLVISVMALLRLAVPAAQPELVKNIYEGSDYQGISPGQMTAAGNRFFMWGTDQAHGRELWVSDGTGSGTHRVKDIREGKNGLEDALLVASGNRVFFRANDGEHGDELWVSDGTEAGTRLVADLRYGEKPSYPTLIQPMKNGVMFVADSDDLRTSLWFTDGTSKGTVQIKVLETGHGEASGNYEALSWMTVKGFYYFFVREPADGMLGLWASDGTVSGTKRVQALGIAPFTDECLILGAVGKTIYFQAPDAEGRRYLWKTEGTAASTMRLKELFYSISGDVLQTFAVIGKQAFMLMENENSGQLEIWTSDGTPAGTRNLADFVGMPALQQVLGLTARGSHLDVIYQGPEDSRSSVWSYDSKTHQGQFLYEPASEDEQLRDFVVVGDQLIFLREKAGAAPSYQLGRLGPQGGEPQWLQEFPGGLWDLSEGRMLALNGHAYLAMYPNVDSWAGLWKTDGTEAGTEQIIPNLDQSPASSYPKNLRTIDGHIYFAATDAQHGTELWRSDGTGGGTVLVADVWPGETGSAPADMVELNGLIYFTAEDSAHGRELWCTDGTAEGTRLVKDLIEGTDSSKPEELIAFGNHVYFRAKLSPTEGWELWRSDGTAEGTVVYATLYPGPTTGSGANPRDFSIVDGWLYFIATNDSALRRASVFRTQGADAGITLAEVEPTVELVEGTTGVTDIAVRPPLPGVPANTVLQPSQSIIYYCIHNSNSSRTLGYLTVNGEPTEILTQSMRSLNSLAVSGVHVFWFSPWGDGGIYISNGTPQNTALLTSYGRYAGAAMDRVFFYNPSSDVTQLRCLQTSPRLVEMTVLEVKEGVTFNPLHAEENTLFFFCSNLNGAPYLMRSSGTPVSTRPVIELGKAGLGWNGLEWSQEHFQVMNEHLYFGGRGAEGVELYALPLQAEVEVALRLPDGSSQLLPPGQAVDFGADGLGIPRQALLEFRNLGYKTLYGLSITTSSLTPEDFAIVEPYEGVGHIAPGQVGLKAITFTPSRRGLRTGSLEISGEGIDLELQLKGRGLGPNDPPVFGGIGSLKSSSSLIREGDSSMIGPPMYGTPGGRVASVWMKDDKQISDEEYISFSSTQFKHAGTYRYFAVNGGGYTEAPPTYIAVVRELSDYVLGMLGKSVTLTCQVAGPASRISYQWRRHGSPLSSSGRIQGAQSAKLTLSDLQLEDAASYDCEVTLHTLDGPQTVIHGATQLGLEDGPYARASELHLVSYLGEPVEYYLELNVEGRIQIKGLPPGLTMNANGVITGNPTKLLPLNPATGQPRPYVITTTVRDAETGRTGAPSTFTWTILPPLQAGDYEGNVPRQADGSDPLDRGGHVRFTISAKNSLSGILRYRGKDHRFTGTAGPAHEGTAVGITIPRKGKSPLTLDVYYDPFTRNCETVLADVETDFEALFIARSRAFTDSAPDLRYEGTHHIALKRDDLEADDNAPAGAGFLTLTINRQAQVKWAGRLADDTPITGSGILGRPLNSLDESGLRIDLHAEPYKQGGALHGFMDGSPDIAGSLVGWTGVTTWNKTGLSKPGKKRAYVQGLPLQTLNVDGSQYLPPVGGNLIFGMQAVAELGGNGAFYLSDPQTLESDISSHFHLLANNRVTLLGDGLSAPLENLTIDAQKGLFSGTVKVEDENPDNPSQPFIRKAKFQGVLLNLQQEGVGFCLLPELPDESGETLSNTPLRSFMSGIHLLR
ncbi:ELWxxDGT repeat protein [Prosthecobacter debontii]|nr:ELWxxDGT repeat protein [Prosthecobacter debontii]